MQARAVNMRGLIFSALVLASSLHAVCASSSPVVDLGYAKYHGSFNSTSGITAFLGIRYAGAPTGNLRFQAPSAPTKLSNETQPAIAEPPMCPQSGGGTATSDPSALQKRDTVTASEDCLFLNVYVSGKVSAGKNLPVVVWIHGGGYAVGDVAVFQGSDLINDANGGVVAVEIQYRLGLFGFLAGSEVKTNGVLNAGLLDQEFALKWVQSHIHSFGGDREKVTIWGESAGAGSVLQHMVAHGGQTEPPLFRAAMTSSTYLPPQYKYNAAIPEAIYKQVVDQASCSNATDTFSCLVSVDTTTLQAVNLNVSAEFFSGTFGFVPVIDGTFIQERPYEAILAGKLNGQALLSVTNTNEGETFVSIGNIPLDEYVQSLFPTLNATQVSRVASEYAGLENGNVTSQAILVYGESIIICPTYTLLKGFNGPSHKGEFAVLPAIHGLDIFSYFPSSLGLTTLPFENKTLDASFAGSFLSVVKTLSPNHNPQNTSITPFWKTYAQGNTEMVFNITDSGDATVFTDITDSALLKRCSFWQSVAELTSQ